MKKFQSPKTTRTREKLVDDLVQRGSIAKENAEKWEVYGVGCSDRCMRFHHPDVGWVTSYVKAFDSMPTSPSVSWMSMNKPSVSDMTILRETRFSEIRRDASGHSVGFAGLKHTLCRCCQTASLDPTPEKEKEISSMIDRVLQYVKDPCNCRVDHDGMLLWLRVHEKKKREMKICTGRVKKVKVQLCG